MQIIVKEERSVWFLERVYKWKFPRLSWNHPDQELLAIHVQYHSRHDEEHYRQCQPCADDHADFMNECEMNARADAE